MIHERELVERAVERLVPPEPAFDRLLLRRNHRRRNERIAALAGIAVFAATVWAAMSGEVHRTSPPAAPDPTTAPAYPGPVGLMGLPPEDATPSSPARGELVVDFMFGHTMGDPGRFGLSLYADGRLIWHRLGDGHTPGLEPTGWIEQRLTAEGVDLVRDEVLATGLFDHDRDLFALHGLIFGDVRVRDGDRMIRVTWGDIGVEGVDRAAPTAEQARALQRLDARLLDLASWLPTSAWEDQELKPFVPSEFSVCYDTDRNVGLDVVLAQLPRRAEDLLRSWDRTYDAIRGGADAPSGIDIWCSRVTPDQARRLAGILDDAESRRIDWDPELGYTFERTAVDVTLWFNPVLPHDV